MADPAGPAGAIDTHTHLNHPRLLQHVTRLRARARAAGLSGMIVVGYDLPSSEQAVALAEAYEDLWAAVGIHPHDAASCNDETLAHLRRLAASPAVVAIGETGLDFYRDLSPRPAQLSSLRRHLDLAEELRMPAILHCRDAQDELLQELDRRPLPNLVWHCFDGSADHARRALDLGLALGFGGLLTYPQAAALRRIAADAPPDRILLETDCPYLVPKPRTARDNEPANLPLIAQRLAELRAESRPDIEALAAGNARRVFNLRSSAEP